MVRFAGLVMASISLTAWGQAPAPAPVPAPPSPPTPPRLLCLYFDLNTLRGGDLLAARNHAIEFVLLRSAPADKLAVMSYTSQVKMLQDFTTDHEKLLAALRSIVPFDTPATNNDAIRLKALQASAKALAGVPDKKAMFFFFGGGPFGKQTDLEPATSALTSAKVAIYQVETGDKLPNLR